LAGAASSGSAGWVSRAERAFAAGYLVRPSSLEEKARVLASRPEETESRREKEETASAAAGPVCRREATALSLLAAQEEQA
jgi:hypothetical protein